MAEHRTTCPSCGQQVVMQKAFGGLRCPLCGHVSGGHHEKEGRGMAPVPADVTRLLRQAAQTDDTAECARLLAEAESVRGQITTATREAGDVDLANTIVAERLTPVRVHEHHTAATDWLADVAVFEGDADRDVLVKASVWYDQRADVVKADGEEFLAQATGMARRVAGAYGERAEAAEAMFLAHVGTLRQREVDTGAITTEAAADTHEPYSLSGPGAPSGLPGEATSSERAPAMRDLMNNTSGGSVSDHGWPDPLQLPQQDVDAANGDSGTSRVASLTPKQAAYPGKDFTEGAGLGPHKLLTDEHDPDCGRNAEGYTHRAGSVVDVLYHHGPDEGGQVWAAVRHRPGGPGAVSFIDPANLRPTRGRNASMQHITAACPECSGCQACGGTHRVAVRHTGASGLDQIDEIVDPHDNPKTTPYPTDVAFPWELDPANQGKTIAEAEGQLAQREQLKGAARQRAEAAARQAYQREYLATLQHRGGQDDAGWMGDMGAGGNRPGMQDTGNPGNTFPGNLTDADPVYGQGGEQGDRPLKPYGEDEANDVTNNPGMNWQPGQPTQYDQAARPNQVGAPTASLADSDPEIERAYRFIRTRRAHLEGRAS